MDTNTEKLSARGDAEEWLAVWVGLAVVTALAVWRLRDFPYYISWITAWRGMAGVLPATLWATVRIWIFWAWSAAVIAGLLLRIDPEIELWDAILAGAASLWPVGYFLGEILGPLGLFNTPTLWSLLALGTVWLWMHPPKIRRAPMTSGQKLALLALGLLAISMIPLQLASPVAPFMDVLATPSAAQRVITFPVFRPFDNDPYGIWVPAAQTPGLELFLAMLGIGADLHRGAGALAQSQSMLPICALMIFGAWRLGKTLLNDTAGGMAALFMFWTCLFRRAQGVRGSVIDLALVGVGLAFFLDPAHRRTLIALGAMMLGTSVASHSLMGGFGMIVAGAGVVFWLFESDYRRFATGVVSLAGATLIAMPYIAVFMAHHVPYLAMAGAIVLGIALCVGASYQLPPMSPVGAPGRMSIVSAIVIALFLFAALMRQSVQRGLLNTVSVNLPLLMVFGFAGLIAAVAYLWRGDQPPIPYAGLIAIALALGLVGEYVDIIAHMPEHQSSLMGGLWDVAPKLVDYWCPFFLLFPAGFVFALAYDRWSGPAAFFALMTLLIYPWYQVPNPVDYDSASHSIPEQWGFNLYTATVGYWNGQEDRHWTFGPEDWALVDVLDKEVAAGRITAATHILHLAQDTSSWSLVQFPVFTGINDDPIEVVHSPGNLFQQGSRVRGMDEIGAALAQQPPYILEQVPPPQSLSDPPTGYDKILSGGYLRLYRRHDLTPTSEHPGVIHKYLVAMLALAATIVMIGRKRRRAETRNPAA